MERHYSAEDIDEPFLDRLGRFLVAQDSDFLRAVQNEDDLEMIRRRIRAQKRQRGRWRWRRQTEVGEDAEDEPHPGCVEHEEGHPAQEAEGEVQPGPQEGARAEVLAQVGHGQGVSVGQGEGIGGGWQFTGAHGAVAPSHGSPKSIFM